MSSRILVAALATVIAGSAGAQKLYKWVDAEGNVHYSDSVPPEHVKQAREEFNEQGIVVERVDRARTPEEIAADEAARHAAEKEALRLERQRQEDARMLATYSSEADIIRSRDQEVDSLQRAINAARAFINGQSKSLATLMERAAATEDRGEKVSDALANSISTAQTQIAEQETFIEQQEQEKERILARYETVLERYRELVRRMEADQAETTSG